ncbi:MAG: D-alanyl-D-alanine carboxypeptidase [Actinomycetota bacterium]|nr:D-alanyl-D-alanine carboxypeptidase [Actinomycetota bacterium]
MYLSIKRHLLCFVAALLVLTPGVGTSDQSGAAQAQEGPVEVTCRACLVFDPATQRVLFARNMHERLPNASTTKMMTALLTVEGAEMGDLVRVPADAAAVGGGGLDLEAGDVFSVRDLLYALLLDSSNEAAAALASHVGGDIDRFVRDMNRAAAALGAEDTSFANPHGLDEPGHVSTAYDLVLIAQDLLATPELARIVTTPRRAIATPEGRVTVENRNLLLESYRGAIGVKTGRTLGAGEVLVAAAERGPRRVIAVAMRSVDAASDSRRLLDLGFARLRLLEKRAAARTSVLVAERERVGSLVFDPGGATGIVAGAEVTGPASAADQVAITFTPSDDLLLPLDAGQEVGTLEVAVGDAVQTIPAVAEDAVALDPPSWGALALSGLLRTAATVIGAGAA